MVLNLNGVKKIMAAAHTKAAEMGVKVNIAVVDARGDLPTSPSENSLHQPPTANRRVRWLKGQTPPSYSPRSCSPVAGSFSIKAQCSSKREKSPLVPVA